MNNQQLNIVILVEGKGDQKFILDFVALHYGIQLAVQEEVIAVGGMNNFVNFRQKLAENRSRGGQNIAIFDADYAGQGANGGFQNRLHYLQQLANTYAIVIDFYLFPNHQDDGTLETLLENVINPANNQVFTCWEQYENCLRQAINPHSADQKFTIPAKKSKIYSYLECLLPNTARGKKLAKDPYRNYQEEKHWAIHDVQNEYTARLKAFLDNYLLNI